MSTGSPHGPDREVVTREVVAEGEARRIVQRRRRILELYLLVGPLSITIPLAVSLHWDQMTSLWAGTAGLWVIGSLAAPLLLYVDATETGATRDIRWTLLATVALPLVGVAYYLRREPAPVEPGRFAGLAGYGVAAGLLGWIAFFIGELSFLYGLLVGIPQPITGSAVLMAGSFGLVLFGLFPFATYADAKFVRTHGVGWDLSPSLRYLGAFVFFSPLLYILPGYVCYHLVRRHRALART